MNNYTRKLVVVGENGNGKSSTCNTLLGKEIFDGAKRLRTTGCESCYLHMNSVDIWVVDSPGMFEPNTVLAERALEIQKSVSECQDPHAFLIVFKAGEQTDERITQTVEMFKLIFGEKMLEHAIIVITKAAFFRNDAEFKAFLERVEIKRIVQQCSKRVVRLENTDNVQKKKRMIDNIFAFVDVVSRMGNHCFKNSDLRCHKAMLEHHLRNINAAMPINEQIQKMKDNLKDKLQSNASDNSGFCDVVGGD